MDVDLDLNMEPTLDPDLNVDLDSEPALTLGPGREPRPGHSFVTTKINKNPHQLNLTFMTTRPLVHWKYEETKHVRVLWQSNYWGKNSTVHDPIAWHAVVMARFISTALRVLVYSYSLHKGWVSIAKKWSSAGARCPAGLVVACGCAAHRCGGWWCHTTLPPWHVDKLGTLNPSHTL